MQNYEVQPGHTLILGVFVYREGDVLPGWAADRDNGLAGRLANGCLAPTGKPVSVSVAPPVAKVADDPAPLLAAECERLRQENTEFAASNRELRTALDGARGEGERLAAELARLTVANAHLAGACEDHQAARDALEAKVAGLTAELEAATAPAAG